MENMENKYFTPDIEDIRVGYECEIKTNHGYESFNKGEEMWQPIAIGYKEKEGSYTNEISNVINGIDDGYQPVRVPYLTKEQIEAEGWQADKNYADIKFTKKVKYYDGVDREIEMKYDYATHIMYLGYDCGDFMLYGIFQGECKDINSFRYISKLLNI